MCQNVKFRAKVKSLNLGPKILYLGYFGDAIFKAFVIFEANTQIRQQICQTNKFVKPINLSKSEFSSKQNENL